MAKHDEASRGNRWVRLKRFEHTRQVSTYNAIEILSFSVSVIVTK
jgi:hypothetical protein